MTKDEVLEALKKKTSSLIIYTHNGEIAWTYGNEKEVIDDYLWDTRWDDRICHLDNILAIKPGTYILDAGLYFGSDPELFLLKNGEVVPSTIALRNEKIEMVAEDGFQVELHPYNNSCRESAGRNIGMAIQGLHNLATRKGYELSFNLAHTISDDVWKHTPTETKRFGCSPTESAHNDKSKRATGLRERFRAGGGHIHIGSPIAKEGREELVKVLDVVVGNTLVLIDRDPANIERRKNYGRAGEYRPKKYGLEYRVPSNFWLRDYVLWSLVGGLVRNALSLKKNGLSSKLLESIDMDNIRKAINENNYELALENFIKYTGFMEENEIYTITGVSLWNVENFLNWVTSEDPLSKINDGTTSTILERWCERTEGYMSGFETFISKQ
jgi:hypothetical protein